MAIAANALTSGTDATPATSFTTASVAPTSNALVLLALVWSDSTVTGGDPQTVTSGAVTFDAIGAKVAVPALNVYLNVYRAMASPFAAGAITVDFSTNTMDGALWSVVEFTGTLVGANGATAVIQNSSASGSGTAWNAGTLAAFGNANNRPYAAFGGNDGNVANVSPEAAWSELHETEVTALVEMKLQTEWKSSATDTTPTATGPNKDFAGIGIEIGMAPTTTSGTKRLLLGVS